ncbi:hypothetical protein Pmani_013669 [Petrolisthes manimaculis]|uniref:Uncharacterized protein n=1 Tax=Petrolisthes manimaculis TaxID=1843537 RepID=A0AAE1PUG1_9EUCA|nr:hypothetical protein Pmani_013669 [Petrolisthes manimaculis]
MVQWAKMGDTKLRKIGSKGDQEGIHQSHCKGSQGKEREEEEKEEQPPSEERPREIVENRTEQRRSWGTGWGKGEKAQIKGLRAKF